MTDPHAGLDTLLLNSGVLAPAWAEAFQGAPRAQFLPEVMWPFDPDTGHSLTVDRHTDPDAWHRWADTDAPITIQWDDGQHTGTAPGRVYTSSASMPSLVAAMLDSLDAHPGMRVLEIGTGTGWNAALLSHRLGAESVTTVEVDPDVATHAATVLHRAGYAPRVATGDGAAGYPDNAPYDRVIATCGMRRIPTTWIEQTRPGGVILAPWGTDYSQRDALVRLVVHGDGSATGAFTGPAEFMKARAQRSTWPRYEGYVTDWPGQVSTTSLPLEAITSGDPHGVTEYVLGLLVPDCAHGVHNLGEEVNAWFFGLSDRSWAVARFTGGEATVHQSGPRRLWDEVEAARRWWDKRGRAGVERFGLTVTPEGQHRVWLDSPSALVVTNR